MSKVDTAQIFTVRRFIFHLLFLDAIEMLDPAGRHVRITILATPNRQRIERKGRCVCRLKLYRGLFSKIATQCVKAGVSARDACERARQSTTEHVLPAVGLSSFRGPIDNGRNGTASRAKLK
jgi:hypothetical protein